MKLCDLYIISIEVINCVCEVIDMNVFIKSQITNMINMTETFKGSCKMAALQDDGIMSKEEEKQIKQIVEATEKFQKALKAIK